MNYRYIVRYIKVLSRAVKEAKFHTTCRGIINTRKTIVWFVILLTPSFFICWRTQSENLSQLSLSPVQPTDQTSEKKNQGSISSTIRSNRACGIGLSPFTKNTTKRRFTTQHCMVFSIAYKIFTLLKGSKNVYHGDERKRFYLFFKILENLNCT